LASSNETRCLRRLADAFFRSHSKRSDFTLEGYREFSFAATWRSNLVHFCYCKKSGNGLIGWLIPSFAGAA
jgi:hypothetical protein